MHATRPDGLGRQFDLGEEKLNNVGKIRPGRVEMLWLTSLIFAYKFTVWDTIFGNIFLLFQTLISFAVLIFKNKNKNLSHTSRPRPYQFPLFIRPRCSTGPRLQGELVRQAHRSKHRSASRRLSVARLRLTVMHAALRYYCHCCYCSCGVLEDKKEVRESLYMQFSKICNDLSPVVRAAISEKHSWNAF